MEVVKTTKATTTPKVVTFDDYLKNEEEEKERKNEEEEKKEEEKMADPLAEQKQLAREIEEIIRKEYKSEDTVVTLNANKCND